ncbi:MAG: UDP-N-acetylglucosamine 2-epimerase (non-hydrolyzing) [bacterium]
MKNDLMKNEGKIINKKKIMFVFGTRPEAIKMAPVIKELEKQAAGFTSIVVVTGQHRQMLDQVLRIFGIKPDHDLEIMEENQSLTDIVTKTLAGMEKIILGEKPDMLLVQGDTSTAFAAGLAAYYQRIPLGHVEAGLRTGDKWQPYPEEINRKLLSDLSDLHFPPTPSALKVLTEEEGISREKIFLTGNTVIDALLSVAGRDYDLAKAGLKLRPGKKLVLVTTHRRENFGGPIKNICGAIKQVASRSDTYFVIPVHKNPKVHDIIQESLSGLENVELIEPQDYEAFVHLMKAAYIILTDSGGVQEEGPSLGKPVLVMRAKTERPDAVTAGTVKLVGTEEAAIVNDLTVLLTSEKEYNKMSRRANPYGDGAASKRIMAALKYYFKLTDQKPEEFTCSV